MDIRKHNEKAWEREVENGNPWTIPVSSEEVKKAKKGDWHIVMTPTLPVPRGWFPKSLKGVKVLCLASGGGQQGPILTAAGADVTVYDNCDKQLARDREVAERESLNIKTIQGDMRDLSAFEDKSFDLIVHPVSNLFVPNIKPVWQEAYRVLKKGGTLISGFCNPIMYMFSLKMEEEEGVLQAKYSIPYSDLEHQGDADREGIITPEDTLEFGHTLDDQIGGQIEAGFVIDGFYEDSWGEDEEKPPLISKYIKSFIATKAVKL